jgi:type IV secretory pathway VirB10-like protein
MGRPVYVLPRQEHIAHLKTHLAFLKSPLFGQNPAIIKTFLYPMATHLRDHILNYYLAEAHEAVDQAQRKELIPEEAEAQVQVILQVQAEIEKQLGEFAGEMAQIEQQAQQFKPQPPMPPDSSMQIAQLNAQVQGQALAQRAQLDAAKLEVDKAKLQLAGQADQQKVQLDAARLQAEDAREQLRQSSEDQRTAIEVKARMAMNNADNETAMRLAAAEIATGDKIAVSTGTGINPNP